MEIDFGSFEEHGDVTVDDVPPGTLLLLQMCIHAYGQGLPRPEDD
jgi:hypothetical protein